MAAVLLFSACGSEAEPTTTSPATTTTTIAPTTTTIAPTTTTVAPTTTTVPPTTTTAAEAPQEDAGLDIDAETTWRDLFNTLTTSEQSCIEDALGEYTEWVLQQVILGDETRWLDAPIYPCLPAPLLEAVFLAGIVWGLELEGLEVGEEQQSCLRELTAEMDGAALLLAIAAQVDAPDESAQMESAAQMLELIAGILRCIPGFEMGVGEDSVLGEDVDPFSWACPMGTSSDGVESATRVGLGESVEGVLESGGDAGVYVFGAVEDELYEIKVELGSLSDSILAVCDAEGFELAWNDDDYQGSLASHLFWRAPHSGDFYVGVAGYSEGSYALTVAVSDIVDDHPDLAVGATAVGVGETVRGVLDYPDDVDVFVLEAVEGELYEIDVTLGTLTDSIVTVNDSDGFELAWNDDYEGSLASRVGWTAPSTGDYYIQVLGYGEGSYSLSVEVSE
ncbi:MAG: PPC domain-containing protein [Actinomycetia bacterium]|nr:PPC domain-containing protein [Actinomycetes bacterium]